LEGSPPGFLDSPGRAHHEGPAVFCRSEKNRGLRPSLHRQLRDLGSASAAFARRALGAGLCLGFAWELPLDEGRSREYARSSSVRCYFVRVCLCSRLPVFCFRAPRGFRDAPPAFPEIPDVARDLAKQPLSLQTTSTYVASEKGLGWAGAPPTCLLLAISRCCR